ncbi:hypothetical protein ABB37_05521 [Leptomonas pyrrhocoris]|uniref:Uncharacterized protein n=1 Tax=Leptomonas pyrrhocoris TaxID=157538 RepID=A0A0M9G0P1_LEPPY|nr:hypothetical protein ABB37_05521 [Leptomonas pyrrhocoris]KPA79776.1 hypothetical protein ABB37_05521 [Leptomonas pyrrhocoris]|eukprot:XP_015658215.1 hypothetical protein ABB37_05521 [Leptomonas pyrrhocoris]
MVTEQADDPAFRFGAPADVVDPILSLLFDLRRMEDTMLSTLEYLGVSRRHLPPPFGEGRRDEEATAQKTATADGEAAGAEAETAATSLSSFDAYVKSVVLHGCTPSAADSNGAVHQVLAWLDGQPPSSPFPVLPTSPAARSLVVAFVAAGGERDAFLTDATTGAEVRVRRPSKRHREDESTGATMPRGTEAKGGEREEACHILSLSAAEVRTAADMCRHYEKLLKSGTADLEATINAVTTSDLAASYSCHAKWVEVPRGDAKMKCVLPASKTVKKNYEQLIRLNDALATCQAAVHRAYVTLEENVDVLLEEAQVVEREERNFQRCIAQARVECAGLQEVRRRLKHTRLALEQASLEGT